MTTTIGRKTGQKLFTLAFAFTLSACSGLSSEQQAENAISELSSPTSFTVSGSGSSQANSNNYIFASSTGTIDTSTNAITATFADPDLPLTISSNTALFTDQMLTGSCNSLAPMIASVIGASSNQVQTQLSATGCTDGASINIILDTSYVADNSGVTGYNLITLTAIVDLAPAVSTVATGNTAADGTGTTEANPNVFSIANDNSITVTFSKNLTQGQLNATLTGCNATLGTPVLVAGSNGTTVAWPLSGFANFSAGTTCALNVSGVADALGNPEDPLDSNLHMTLTFQ